MREVADGGGVDGHGVVTLLHIKFGGGVGALAPTRVRYKVYEIV